MLRIRANPDLHISVNRLAVSDEVVNLTKCLKVFKNPPLSCLSFPINRPCPEGTHEPCKVLAVMVKVRKPVWAKARVMDKDLKPNDLTQQQNWHPCPYPHP